MEHTMMDRIDRLTNASVDDMVSSLPYYRGDNAEDKELIRRALARCQRRGEKTKARLLLSKLRKMEIQNAPQQ